MRRLLVTLGVILSLLALPSHAAEIWHRGTSTPSSGGPVTGCSAFTGAAAYGVDDGCSNAKPCSSAGLAAGICLQDLNAFTETTQTPNHIAFPQSGQTYASNIHTNTVGQVNWNVACVDYACGVDTTNWPFCNGPFVALDNPTKPCSTDSTGASTGFIDAATYDFATDPGGLGIGCHAVIDNRRGTSSSGAAAQHSLNCQTSAIVSLNGFDMSPWCPGSRTAAPWLCPSGGAYICIGFEVDNTHAGAATTGIVSMTNNMFRYQFTTDSSCNVDVLNGNTSPFWYKINGNSTTGGWELDFRHNYLELGGALGFTPGGVNNFQPIGGTPPARFYNNSGGTNHVKVYVEYNLFQNVPFRGLLPGTPCDGFYVNYNGVHNLGHNSGGGHAELYQNGNFGSMHCQGYSQATAWGHMLHFITINNTFWEDTHMTSSLDAFFNSNAAYANSADLVAIDDWQFGLNTLVQNAPPAFAFLQDNINYATGGSSTGYTAHVGDSLQIQIPSCSVLPTVYLASFSVSGGAITGNVQPAWLGSCPSAPATSSYPLWCQTGSCSDGTVGNTGYTISLNSGNWNPPNQTVGTGQDIVGGDQYGGPIGSLTLTAAGSGYTDGTYTNQPLTYFGTGANNGLPTGSGATADIVVGAPTCTTGTVCSMTINQRGLVYISFPSNDVLTWTGAGGTGAKVNVASLSGAQGNGQYVVNFMDVNVLNVMSNAIDPTGLQFPNPWFSMKFDHNLGISCGAYANVPGNGTVPAGTPVLPAVSPANVAPSSTAYVGYISGFPNHSAENMVGNLYLTGGTANALGQAINPWTFSNASGYTPGSGC